MQLISRRIASLADKCLDGILPRALALVLLLGCGSANGQTATWSPSPVDSAWNTGANWSTGTAPNGPTYTATFDLSSKTSISLPVDIEVNALTFSSTASAYTFTVASSNTTGDRVLKI